MSDPFEQALAGTSVGAEALDSDPFSAGQQLAGVYTNQIKENVNPEIAKYYDDMSSGKEYKDASVGYFANLRDPSNLRTNEGWLKSGMDLLWQHVGGQDSPSDATNKFYAKRGESEILGGYLDTLDQMEAAGMQNTPEYAKALDEYKQFGKNDPTPDVTLSMVWEGVKADPGGVMAQVTNAALEDPELFILPWNWEAAAVKVGGTLAKYGKTAATVGSTAARTASASAIGAATFAAGESLHQLDNEGKLDEAALIQMAKAGGAFGAVLGMGVSVAKALRSPGTNKAIVQELKSNVRQYVDDPYASKLAEEGSARQRIIDKEMPGETFADEGATPPRYVPYRAHGETYKGRPAPNLDRPPLQVGYMKGEPAIPMVKEDWTTSLGASDVGNPQYFGGLSYEPPRLSFEQWRATHTNPKTGRNYETVVEDRARAAYAEYKQSRRIITDSGYRAQDIYTDEIYRNTFLKGLQSPVSAKEFDKALGFAEIEKRMDTPMLKAFREAHAMKKQGGSIDRNLLVYGGALSAGALVGYSIKGDWRDAVSMAAMLGGAAFAGQVAGGYLRNLFARSTGRTIKDISAAIDPMSYRLRKLSPKITHKLTGMYRRNAEETERFARKLVPFIRQVKKLKNKDYVAYENLWEAMYNGDKTAIVSILKNAGIDDTLYRTYRETMDVLYDMQIKSGRKLPKIDEYTHRSVKDFDALRKTLKQEHRARIDQLLEDMRVKRSKHAGHPVTLTNDEINDVYSNYLRGFYDSDKKILTPSSAKARKLPELTREQLHAYHNIEESIDRYIRETIEDVNRRNLFGKDIVEATGDDVTAGVERFVNSRDILSDVSKLSAQQVDELKDMLDVLMTNSRNSPNRLIKFIRNVTYAGLLGNAVGAARQVGDVFLSAYKNGVVSTVAAAAQHLSGKSKLSPKEMGYINHAAEEFVSDIGASRTLLDFSFKYGGFNTIDGLGKGTILNAALRKYQKLVGSADGIEKIAQKYEAYYGDDFLNLVDDLKNKTISNRVKDLVVHELGELQPISIMEMPEVYIKNPNLRLFYTLRTFQLKHINLMRRDIIDMYAKGHYKQATKNLIGLTGYFTAGGMTGDAIIAALIGRDYNAQESAIDNVLKSSAILNKYSLGLFNSYEPISEVAGNFLMPPLTVFDPAVRNLLTWGRSGEIESMNWAEVGKYVPIFGRLNYELLGGGLEKYQKQQHKKSGGAGGDITKGFSDKAFPSSEIIK